MGIPRKHWTYFGKLTDRNYPQWKDIRLASGQRHPDPVSKGIKPFSMHAGAVVSVARIPDFR